MTIDLFILIFCSAAITLLGLLVFMRNPSQSSNRRFVLLSASVVLWTLFNYLSDNASKDNLLFTRLTFLGGVASVYYVLNFIAYFPNNTIFRKNLLLQFHRLLTILITPIVFLPAFISSVSKESTNGTITTSHLYPLFILYVAYSLIMLFWIIFKQITSANSYIQKQQIIIISWGIILYAVFAILANVLLPLLTNTWSISRFGPVFTLFFVGMAAYTMVKHRLFDIRGFVVRGVVYLLTFSVIALIYILPAVVVTTYIINAPLKASTIALLSLMTMVAAIFFQPLRSRFNKTTSRIFFRDYYDPREVLDLISSFLVGTVNVKDIEKKSSNILIHTIKPSSVKYLLLAESKREDQDTKELIKLLSENRSDIIIFDEIDEHKQVALREAMAKKDFAVAVRLRTTHGDLGYMALGFKQSGSVYSGADSRLLGTVADELAVGLQNALRFEEIQQFNITLQQKVDEATKELRRANTRLKELDATKDEFISMASHQLRTPLTTVKGYLSMILEGDVGAVKKDQKELMQHAFDGANRMVYLIADLLNVSRLQTGKFVIDNRPTNLEEVVSSEISQLNEQAANREIKLVYHKPDGFPVLNLDETKIRQVVMNFLDNALYYTPKGGSVTVDLRATDKEVSYTVADTGVGVPKDAQHHLFSKFYRADNARKMRPDGTGLGLYMAKKVIAAQGGAIIFKSTEGKGSTFGFSFPRRVMEADTAKTKP